MYSQNVYNVPETHLNPSLRLENNRYYRLSDKNPVTYQYTFCHPDKVPRDQVKLRILVMPCGEVDIFCHTKCNEILIKFDIDALKPI